MKIPPQRWGAEPGPRTRCQRCLRQLPFRVLFYFDSIIYFFEILPAPPSPGQRGCASLRAPRSSLPRRCAAAQSRPGGGRRCGAEVARRRRRRARCGAGRPPRGRHARQVQVQPGGRPARPPHPPAQRGRLPARHLLRGQGGQRARVSRCSPLPRSPVIFFFFSACPWEPFPPDSAAES